MDRITEIVSNIKPCDRFIDVGCDHGYVAKRVVEKKLAKTVIVSDISPKCLQKAEELLFEEIDEGVVKPIVTDGLKGIRGIDQALIAGMGGEEIIKILSEAEELPDILVLQPMKNVDKVRKYLCSHGYRIEKDYVFFDKKYYDLIVATVGKDELSSLEIKYGRTNLIERREAFLERLKIEKEKKRKIIQRDIKEDMKKLLLSEIEEMEGILNDSRGII